MHATERAAEAGSSQRAAAVEIRAHPDKPSTQRVSRAIHTALFNRTDATGCWQEMTQLCCLAPQLPQPVLVCRRLLHGVLRKAAVLRHLQ